MRSIITEFAITLSRSIDLTILVKATLMLVMGLIIAGLAVRAQASLRHLVFATTFATVLALPLVAITVPDLTIEIPVTPAAMPVNVSNQRDPASTVADSPGVGSKPAILARENWPASSLATVFRSVWIVGGLLLIFSLAFDLWRVRLLRRNGLPSARLRNLTKTLAAEGSIRRPVEVLLHEDIQAPLTYGFRRPVIMLPPDAVEWAENNLRRAIIHELEHVRRGDWVTQLAARVICAFYWFHPLAWMAWRKLCLEAERACDDAVVQSARHTEYAEQLVSLSRQLSNVRTQPILSMAKRSDLSRRVSALLDSSQRRGRAGLLAAACSVLVGGLAVISIGPLKAVAQSATPPAPERESNRRGDVDGTDKGSPLDRALYRAAKENNTTEINKLLEAGANINCALDGDGSPLIAASRNGHLEAAQMLLDRGADPNMAVSGDGNPLIMAAREGHEEMVTLLLNRGADVNRIVPSDENALIQASGGGHLQVVKLLITRGADVNARVVVEPNGPKSITETRTPLGIARKGGHRAVVAYLISLGARD